MESRVSTGNFSWNAVLVDQTHLFLIFVLGWEHGNGHGQLLRVVGRDPTNRSAVDQKLP